MGVTLRVMNVDIELSASLHACRTHAMPRVNVLPSAIMLAFCECKRAHCLRLEFDKISFVNCRVCNVAYTEFACGLKWRGIGCMGTVINVCIDFSVEIEVHKANIGDMHEVDIFLFGKQRL